MALYRASFSRPTTTTTTITTAVLSRAMKVCAALADDRGIRTHSPHEMRRHKRLRAKRKIAFSLPRRKKITAKTRVRVLINGLIKIERNSLGRKFARVHTRRMTHVSRRKHAMSGKSHVPCVCNRILSGCTGRRSGCIAQISSSLPSLSHA